MAQTTLKAIKGGKTDEDPSVRHVTIRGTEYTVREIDVTEYDKIIEAIADPDTGTVRFDKLLRAMVMKCVTPLPSTPFKFPVYRTLEGIVNDMHYTDLKVEAGEVEEPDEEGEPAPNS